MSLDVGQKVGRLTLLSIESEGVRGAKTWRVKCSCGRERLALEKLLKSDPPKLTSCGCRKSSPICKGERFGRLTADHKSEISTPKNPVWVCRCDCGTSDYLAYSGNLRSGRTTSCGCSHLYLKGGNHPQWGGFGEISGTYFDSIKSGRGRKKQVPFDLKIEYLWDLFLSQGRKCALSGEPLVFAPAYESFKQTASLDRIDSNLGYFVGNVQWVHKDVNRMKNAFSQDRFVEICQLVARKFPGRSD